MLWCSGAVIELCTDHLWTFEPSVPVCDFAVDRALPWKYAKWRKFLDVKETALDDQRQVNTGLSKKMDGIWNRYNLKSTGRIYTFGILKCSEKFKVLDLP